MGVFSLFKKEHEESVQTALPPQERRKPKGSATVVPDNPLDIFPADEGNLTGENDTTS